MSYLLSPVPISLLTIAKTFYQQKKGQNLTSLIPKFTGREPQSSIRHRLHHWDRLVFPYPIVYQKFITDSRRGLAAPSTRNMDWLHAAHRRGAPLDSSGDAWAGLCHLSDRGKLRCDSCDRSRAAPFVDCLCELCHLQSVTGAATIPG